MPEVVLGETRSLCPVCLRALPARRVAAGGDVYLVRACPEHGEFRIPVWSGEPSMPSWRRPKAASHPNPTGDAALGCPFDCGLCREHAQHTCTALVEITSRCDLGCPVCFASAGGEEGRDPSLAELAARFRTLKATADSCNLQLSGGEPTVRTDLPGIIAEARKAGFSFVQLNTNGLRLAREPGYVQTLADAGLSSVFLQFDGSDKACLAIRGQALRALKLKAVSLCAKAGLGVVLVPTLVRGVNDGEVGDIVSTGILLGEAVRGVHFQPMAAFGRYPGHGNGSRPTAGPTLPEVLSALERQTGGLLSSRDFHPPGCEHELCSFSATFLRLAHGGLRALPADSGSCCAPPPTAKEGADKSKAFTARQWSAPPPAKPLSASADDFDRFLAAASQEKRFTISCMAFQDAWTIDLERAKGCCIHVQAPDGRLVPFCLYNLTGADGRTLYRGNMKGSRV